MLEAAFWGLVAASTLIVGAVLAIVLPWRRRMIGLGAGFGAGALISAVTLDLTRSAFEAADDYRGRGRAGRGRGRLLGRQLGAPPRGSGAPPQAVGRPAGGRRPARDRARDGPRRDPGVGRHRDFAPGRGGRRAGVPGAVAISNLPEAISATTGLRRTGWSTRRVLRPLGDRRGPERRRGGRAATDSSPGRRRRSRRRSRRSPRAPSSRCWPTR